MQADWPRYEPDPQHGSYLPVPMPALVITEAYDPTARPRSSASAPRSAHRPAPDVRQMACGAHGVLTSSPVGGGIPHCPVQLPRAFLDEPTSELPAERVERVLAPTLVAPADLAMRPISTSDAIARPAAASTNPRLDSTLAARR